MDTPVKRNNWDFRRLYLLGNTFRRRDRNNSQGGKTVGPQGLLDGLCLAAWIGSPFATDKDTAVAESAGFFSAPRHAVTKFSSSTLLPTKANSAATAASALKAKSKPSAQPKTSRCGRQAPDLGRCIGVRKQSAIGEKSIPD